MWVLEFHMTSRELVSADIAATVQYTYTYIQSFPPKQALKLFLKC